MDDHPVSSIEIKTQNNDDYPTLSICTGSNIIIFTPNRCKQIPPIIKYLFKRSDMLE